MCNRQPAATINRMLPVECSRCSRWRCIHCLLSLALRTSLLRVPASTQPHSRHYREQTRVSLRSHNPAFVNQIQVGLGFPASSLPRCCVFCVFVTVFHSRHCRLGCTSEIRGCYIDRSIPTANHERRKRNATQVTSSPCPLKNTQSIITFYAIKQPCNWNRVAVEATEVP